VAVLIEAISVVVKISAIQERYPGGWDAFKKNVPNQTLCADSKIARVGFMSPADVEAFVKSLEKNNLVFQSNGDTQDLAVVDQQRGFSLTCSWAEFGTVQIDGNKISACQVIGDESGEIMFPDGWQYEGSLSQTFAFAPTEHVDKSLKFLRHEKGLDVYLNTLTGKEVYIGRTGET
jgi:hypothetical protein